MGQPEFRKLAPHVYLQAYPGEVADGVLAEFLAMIEREQPTLDRPHGWIADFRSLQSASAKQRRMMAEFQERTARIDRLHNAGSALVVPSTVVRGLVTAVHWLAPPVYPTTVVATREAGLRWVADQLAERGVRVHVDAIEL